MKQFKKNLAGLSFFILVFLVQNLFAQTLSFSTDSLIASNCDIYGAACADFNGDAAIDIATVQINNPGYGVAIYLNTGQGVFNSTADSIYPTENLSKAIDCADLNGDNLIDLAATFAADSSLVIYFGNGDGTFSEQAPFKLSSQPRALKIYDLNLDDLKDIVTVTSHNEMYIYFGNGDGTFQEPTIQESGGTSSDVEIYDINNDNYPDIFVGVGNTSNLSFFLNDSSGAFPERNREYTYRPPWYVVVTDINQDNLPDLVLGSGSWDFDNVMVLMADSLMNFSITDTISVCSYNNDLTAADFNNDGKDEILVIDNYGVYYINIDSCGHLVSADTISFNESDRCHIVKPADVNNDGKMDLLIGKDDGLSIYYNTYSETAIKSNQNIIGSFELKQNYPNPFNPNTTIQYQLQKNQKVELTVYNLLGEKILTLVNAYQNAGRYSINFNANKLASGIYFYRLKTDTGCAYRKMHIIK